MESAISMYFFGDKIKASECDYDSYKELGLQCKSCYAEVVLAKGLVIAPHFRHPKERDPEPCEKRIKNMTGEEWKKVESNSRGQLLKFYQQHFYKIVNQTYSNINLPEVERSMILNPEPHFEIWIPYLDEYCIGVQKRKDDLIRIFGKFIDELKTGKVKVSDESKIDSLAKFTSALMKRQQMRSVECAIEFLCRKRNHEILKIFAAYSLFEYMVYFAEKQDGFHFPEPANRYKMYPWMVSNMIGLLMAIPWAGAANDMRVHGSVQPVHQITMRPRYNGNAVDFDW